MTPAVTISHGLTAVFLDPPYGAARTANLYTHDSPTVAADARAWAIENGDNPHLRICLAGYVDEHAMPASWRVVRWKAKGGYANQAANGNANAGKEALWFSPWCLGGERASGPLFASIARGVQ